MEELILYFSLKYSGHFHSIYNALKRHEKVDENLKNEMKKKLKCKYTTIFSDDYPDSLKKIKLPPFVLYYYGDLSLINNKAIAVTGIQKVSAYGERVTNKFIKELVENKYSIISGLEKGINYLSNYCTVNYNGKAITVLGTGIENQIIDDKELYEILKKNHLIISEYPFQSVTQKNNKTFHNRIISGLSHGLLIPEINLKSESMIAVEYALEQGKEIYCVPARYDDSNGCNYLIQNGAKLVLDIEDIKESFSDEYI